MKNKNTEFGCILYFANKWDGGGELMIMMMMMWWDRKREVETLAIITIPTNNQLLAGIFFFLEFDFCCCCCCCYDSIRTFTLISFFLFFFEVELCIVAFVVCIFPYPNTKQKILCQISIEWCVLCLNFFVFSSSVVVFG